MTTDENGVETVSENPVDTTEAILTGRKADFAAFHYTMVNLKQDDGSYAESVSYKYIIKEFIPDGATKQDDGNYVLNGVTYDGSEHPVTITVTDNRSGELVVDYDGATTFRTPAFSNEYAAEGDAQLDAEKAANELLTLANKTFTFELYEVKVDEEGNEVVGTTPIETTAAVAAGEKTGFTGFHYTMEDLKQDDGSYATSVSYKYIIKETIPDGVDANNKLEGVVYDTTEYPVTIKVTDNRSGKLVVTYNGSTTFSTPAFENAYESEGEIQFYAKKTLVRRDLEEGEFSFELKDEAGNVLQTKQNDAFGIVTFDPITYNQDDMTAGEAEIKYTINEVQPEDPTVAYDTTVYEITVELKDNWDGTIDTSATPDATDPDNITISFTNVVTRILKVDAEHNEKALPDAVIEVYDDSEDPETPIDTITTTVEPIEIKNLETGKLYRLHEESAPHGYLPWDLDVYFWLNAEGDIVYGDTVTGDGLPAASDKCIIGIDENGTIRVQDTMKKVSIAVHKVWDDDNNRDGVRPISGITVSLLRNGAEYKTVRLDPANNWTAMVTNLDAVYVKDGEIYEYTYTWSEPAVEYYTLDAENTKIIPVTLSSTEGGEGTLSILTNKYIPETTEIEVQKIWDDNDNAAKKRTPSVTVELYADGEAIAQVKLDESNNWKYTWKDLPKCTNSTGLAQDSKEIKYTVAELDIPEDYEVKITPTGKGYKITNTYGPGKLIIEKQFDIEPWEPFTPDDSPKDIPVIKTWNDNNNEDGNRPAAITVHLFADGEEVASAQLTEETGWKYTFTGMPRLSEDGEKIVYTVTEDPVAWYEAEIHGFNIRNNYKPELTSVSVKKVWDDNNNQQNLRPTSIAMTLSNGMVVILNAENNWTATIENLPTRVNGEPVIYTWTEQKILNYDQTNVETIGDLTIFTNTVWTRKEDTTGGKKPKTPGTPTEIIEEYETPLGVEVIINHVGDCFD